MNLPPNIWHKFSVVLLAENFDDTGCLSQVKNVGKISHYSLHSHPKTGVLATHLSHVFPYLKSSKTWLGSWESRQSTSELQKLAKIEKLKAV